MLGEGVAKVRGRPRSDAVTIGSRTAHQIFPHEINGAERLRLGGELFLYVWRREDRFQMDPRLLALKPPVEGLLERDEFSLPALNILANSPNVRRP